jgi:hypothetical protein
MRVRIEQSAPRYCDIGQNKNFTRVMVNAIVYLTPEELEEYHKAGNQFTISIGRQVEEA